MRPALFQSRLNSTVAAIGAHPLSERRRRPALTFYDAAFRFVTLRRQNGGSDFPGRIPTSYNEERKRLASGLIANQSRVEKRLARVKREFDRIFQSYVKGFSEEAEEFCPPACRP
jgi:hypothetical protein